MQPKSPIVSALGPTSFADAPTDDDPTALVGQVVAERYEVQELLGTGGMGCVYRARHIHIRKQVALKTLHDALLRSPEAVARFEREAVAAARIDHPNVVVATDFGHLPSGRYYLVLEFVEGQDLRHELDAQGKLPLARALSIAHQIASGLSAAHPLGIVHRDLKPENVMLVQRPGRPDLVKVLDFGIAKITLEDKHQPLTQFGAVFGTPQYMSPEQAAGKDVDGRSDLYSLGIIIYEMLTGTLPLEAADALGFIMQQLNGVPAALPNWVPEPVRALVHTLLEKDPENRPSSASEVTACLERMLVQHQGTVGTLSTVHAGRLFAGLGRRLWARAWPQLKQPRRVGKLSLPTGAWLASLVVSLVALGLWLRPDASTEANVTSETRTPISSPIGSSALPTLSDSDFAVELERIELLKVYQRTEHDWMLLARGSTKLGRYEQAALAYQALLSLRADFRKDPGLLTDLLTLSREPKAFRIVLNLAESVLGKHGIDLIWEMWQRERVLPDRKEQSDKLAKKLVILSMQASPGLRAAIELTSSSNCEKLLTALGRAATEADARSRTRLAELARSTGCGPTHSDDCYPCLRQSPTLAQAIEHANANLAPSLGGTKEE